MEIFNSEFGLNQLNQNHELLCRLLTKFIDDYQSAQSKLLDMLEQRQWDSAVLLIHTIKGISGNLGLEALYDASKALEEAAKAQTLTEQQLKDLGNLIAQTIKEVNHFINTEVAPQTVYELNANKADTVASLISVLEKNQFVPSDKLASYMQNIDISQSEKDDLLVYIQQLNYEDALDILRKI
ncbi:Hpt domain-containing protein [Opacimonas viscosa]|uniref:Hpt domain-containing protein n=1 Tax=Opacimonas viscosa TaxID=2961944 RepID=A0AA41X6I0_9ALTE|nr:Hpt domain-containing protein [Opacimonas viscosa]MCP3429479.1 Hpt domain-containing protein [Opacimonas viscosa]